MLAEKLVRTPLFLWYQPCVGVVNKYPSVIKALIAGAYKAVSNSASCVVIMAPTVFGGNKAKSIFK